MKEKTTAQKYKYYKPVLDKLGDFPLSKNPTIKDMKLSRGVIQAAYKEMYKIDFEGTIIDYLCWISALSLLEEAKESTKDLPIKKYDGKSFKPDCSKASMIVFYMLRHHKIESDFKNLVRLFVRNPKILLDWIYKNSNIKYDDNLDVKIFEMICFILTSSWQDFLGNELIGMPIPIDVCFFK